MARDVVALREIAVVWGTRREQGKLGIMVKPFRSF
jgi:hypothetical protein